MNKYVILPSCDDTNRGDQALVWETVEVAKSAGFIGDFYLITEKEKAKQSIGHGLIPVDYVLPHPSSKGKENENRKYGFWITVKWAFRSAVSLLLCAPLLNRFTRALVRLFLPKNRKQALKIISSCDAAFVKGGGFLHDYGGTVIEKYKIYFLLYHIRLVQSFGIPVYVMPNSYGPFESSYTRRIVGNTLKKCKLVSSRESISKNCLKEQCKVDSLLSMDLANYLEKDDLACSKELFKEKGVLLVPGKTVGITVRPYRFPGCKNPEQLYMNYKIAVFETIKWLKNSGFFPILIEHVFATNTHEQDMICIKEIKEMLGQEDDIPVFSNLELNCKQMKTLYGGIDFLIGTRFHSVIFSATQLKPCIAITYGGNKGEGIMKDMGLSEYCISISEITGKELVKRFENLYKNKETIIKKLEVFVDSIGDERNRFVKQLRESDESIGCVRQ